MRTPFKCIGSQQTTPLLLLSQPTPPLLLLAFLVVPSNQHQHKVTSHPASTANNMDASSMLTLYTQQASVGRCIAIQGRVREAAKSFTFSLRADDGPVLTGLPDLQTQNTTLNSNSLVSWKVQGETQEDFPFVPQRDFEVTNVTAARPKSRLVDHEQHVDAAGPLVGLSIVISCEAERFHMSVDGAYWLDSAHREPVQC
ncbi:uncharacterized protein LOC144050855 isoform X4 [Vanacampus margaritifer]